MTIECPHCHRQTGVDHHCVFCGGSLTSPDTGNALPTQNVGKAGDTVNVRPTLNAFGNDAIAALAPQYRCPICGRTNAKTGTFRCKACERDDICLTHQDPQTYECKECASKAHGPRDQGPKGGQETNRASWLLRRFGILTMVLVAIGLALVAARMIATPVVQPVNGMSATPMIMPRCSDSLIFGQMRAYLKTVEDESRRQSFAAGLRGCQISSWEGWVDDFTNGGTRVKIDMDPPSISSIHDVEFDIPGVFVGKLQKNDRIVFDGAIDYATVERRLGVTSLRVYLLGVRVTPK